MSKHRGARHRIKLGGLACMQVFAVALPSFGADLQPGFWRAWLDCKGRDLRFGLEVVQGGDSTRAWILNGEERVRVPKVYVEDGEIVFDIDYYDAGFRATPNAEGTHLYGSWWRRIGDESKARLPFEAELCVPAAAENHLPAVGARVTAKAPVATDAGIGTAIWGAIEDRVLAQGFAGRWAVKFSARSDSSVGLFRLADDGTMRGTFLHTTGDYRHLAGTVKDGKLQLSRFDGAHAFLFEAALEADGTIRGEFLEGGYHQDAWFARADNNARMPDSFGHFQWKGGLDIRHPTFVDLEGKPRSFAELAPGAKAVVVEIFGTWCPNCHDSMVYLKELYDRYRDRGLSVIGLAFEMTQDFERNAKMVRLYRERFGVDYPMLLSAKGTVIGPEEAFPNIKGLYGIPTILFLRADGTVRAVHTGFAGPAAGEDHVKMRNEIEAIVRELIE